MTPEWKCPYCEYETGIPELMRDHHQRAHPGKPFIEPDPEPRDSPFHKRIEDAKPIAGTKGGHSVVLECGHRVQTFGDLSKAGGRVLCTRCRDLAELQSQAHTPPLCHWCEEAILIFDPANPARTLHRECAIRGVAGSVAHQLQLCSCHGGRFEDPPGITKREAAKAASALAVELQAIRDRYEKLYERTPTESTERTN